MANLCFVDMKVLGHEHNIDAFVHALKQEGNTWIGRGMDAQIDYSEDVKNHNNIQVASISGDTKWSVQSSLIDNARDMAYQAKTGEGPWYSIKKDDPRNFIDLAQASEIFDIDIELYSEEAGCEFAEHFIFSKGKQVLDDVVDFFEYDLTYPRDCDQISKDKAEKMYGIEITDQEWKYEDYINRGGFEETWDFIENQKNKLEQNKKREPYNPGRNAKAVAQGVKEKQQSKQKIQEIGE